MKLNTGAKLAILSVTLLSIASLTVLPSSASASSVSGASVSTTAERPVWISIPAIKLSSPVQGVGVDKKGNMGVPSSKTKNVGWYQYGVTPGGIGTAVLDAHNTAAFKNLDNVPVGADIYISTSLGNTLHFTVTKEHTYSMKTLKSSTLFAPSSTAQINLITCAGKLLGNGEATHRLIVSAELV